jgi:hypothetical protein
MRLAAELAVGLARRLCMTLEPSDDGFYWHFAQSTFEEACDVLWELGVASTLVATESGHQGMTRQQYVDAKPHPGEQAFAVYKFFSAPETRAGVLAGGELPDALFARLLASYVETACEYGPNGTQLDSGEGPFKPAAEFEREIDAFVACGYAERHGDMVKWTDKIAPVMYGGGSLVAMSQRLGSRCRTTCWSVSTCWCMTTTPSRRLPSSGRQRAPALRSAGRMSTSSRKQATGCRCIAREGDQDLGDEVVKCQDPFTVRPRR